MYRYINDINRNLLPITAFNVKIIILTRALFGICAFMVLYFLTALYDSWTTEQMPDGRVETRALFARWLDMGSHARTTHSMRAVEL